MDKSVSSLITFVAILFCIVFFVSCKKEYSYEGGIIPGASGGTAKYTLKGAGGSCTGSTVSGDYYSGVALAQSNTVTLFVIVDSVGTYTVTTNSVNGFSFSASGSFTSTGEQTITLTASGTPVSPGDFTFAPAVGLGCAYTVTVIIKPQAVAAFTLAGAPNNCTNPQVTGDYTPGKALTIGNTVVLAVDVTSVGAYLISTDTLDGFSFSAAGTFTATGNQRVTLVGTGTPELARYLTFTPIAGTSACVFTVPVIDPEPLATYVLESGFGNPNPCIYTLQGSFTAGTPLSVADGVSMRVFVTIAGNFTIATNTVNGIMFSYSGTFTVTGLQYVVLSGSGTPAVPGSYSFIPQIVGPHPLGGESCAFVIPVK